MPIPNSLTIPFPNPSRSSHELWVNWWEWRWGLFFRPELGSSCWLNPTDNCWQLFNMPAFLQVPHLFFPTTRDSVWNFSEAPLCTGGHRKELRPGSENKSHVRWESRSGSRRISYLTHLKPTNSLLEIRTIWMILFWSLKKKKLSFNLLSVFKYQVFFKLYWGINFFICICVALWEALSLESHRRFSDLPQTCFRDFRETRC